MVQRAYRQRSWRDRLRWFSGQYVTSQADSAGRLAACLGVGVCMGILPIWGFQMIVAALVAHVLRLNKLLVLLASNISFGGMAAVIILLSAAVGRLVLGSDSSNFWDLPTTASQAGQRLGEYLVGSVVLALAAGLLTAAVTYGVARLLGYRNAQGRSDA